MSQLVLIQFVLCTILFWTSGSGTKFLHTQIQNNGIQNPAAAFGGNAICAHCRAIMHIPCIMMYCARRPGGFIPVGPGPQPVPFFDPTCAYCQQTGNLQCIRQYCARMPVNPPVIRPGVGQPVNAIIGVGGFGPASPYQNGNDVNRCLSLCQNDVVCIRRMCNVRTTSISGSKSKVY